MADHRSVRRSRLFCWFLLLLPALFLAVDANQAEARRRGGSGNSSAMRAAMQKELQYEQKMGTAQQKKDKETIARFDTNGNGKIDVNEKPAWDKFWREVGLGKQPHPYASITPDDLKDSSKTSKSKK